MNRHVVLHSFCDKLIAASIVLAWLAGTVGYYLLFQSAAKATLFVAHLALFIAAFFAVGYSALTVILLVVLPLSHLWKALRNGRPQ